MSKTLIVTGCHKSYKTIYDLTIKSKRDWTDKWGYELLESKFEDGLHLGWTRLHLAIDMRATDRWDRVIWLDADTIITNPRLPAPSTDHTAHISVSRDWHDNDPDDPDPKIPVSCGNFIVNRVDSHLQFVLEKEKRKAKHEQEVIRLLVNNPVPYVEIQVLPWYDLNPVPLELRPNHNRSIWNPNHLLAHCTADCMDDRIKFIKSIHP